MTSSIRIPSSVRFPAIRYDPADDTIEFDAQGIWRIIEINPDIEWSECTIPLLLAEWFLHEFGENRIDPMLAAVLTTQETKH